MSHSAIGLILQAGWVVKGVLIILLLFSVVSWAIIFFKWRYFSKAKRENAAFFRSFTATPDGKSLYQAAKGMTISPNASVFKAVFIEGHTGRDEVRRSIRRYVALESAKLERYLNFLATTGSSTPFIGLFGTVWGIMNAFRGIGAAGSASLSVVAPGIAEALITTAAGLAAAIPAVIGYNYYLSMSRGLIIEMEDFAEDLLNYLSGVQQ